MADSQKPAVPFIPSITDFIRRFLCKLIVDILVEFYTRCKSDPEFHQRLTAAFGKLDSAQSQEENDKAISEIQDMVNS